MNRNFGKIRARFALFLVAVGALLLGGCWEQRLVWAPDGSRAAVITKDGLHLCTADGELSPLLVPGAYRAAWLGDSQHLVLARSREVNNLTALAAIIGPARMQSLGTKAEGVWQKMQNGVPKDEISIRPDDDIPGIVLYLREHHRDALREKMAKDWNDIETLPASVHTLVLGTLTGSKIDLGPTLHEGLGTIGEIHPAPGDRAVAFVTHFELSPTFDNSLRILLAPIDGSTPALLVASNTAASPDWTPDGRSLVYFKSSAPTSDSEELRLGALVEREVLDAAGHIALSETTRDLAGLIFQDLSRVRCLRNGMIIFSAAEFHLPVIATAGEKREQLFQVPRAGAPTIQAILPPTTLELLPQSLAYFDLSPDETQVLVAGSSQDLWLVTLANGDVQRIGHKGDNKEILPSWRRAGEFAYVRKTASGASESVVVLRRAQGETVLSQTWPAETLRRLVE